MGVCVDRVRAWNDGLPDPYENGFGWALLGHRGVRDRPENRARQVDTSDQCYDILATCLTEANAVPDAATDVPARQLAASRDSFPTW